MTVQVLLINGAEPRVVRRSESLVLGYMASSLRAHGYSCAIVERGLMEWSLEETAEILELLDPQWILIDPARGLIDHVSSIIELIRETTDAEVAVCGVSSSQLEALASAMARPDVAILGEGEEIAAQWIAAREEERALDGIPNLALFDDGEWRVEFRDEEDIDPDGFRVPARDDLAEWSRVCGVATVRVARRTLDETGAWTLSRLREPEAVIDEIETLVREFGLRRYALIGFDSHASDDGSVTWLRRLLREGKRRELAFDPALVCYQDALDPDFLSSLKAMHLRVLMVQSGTGHSGEYGKKAWTISLARELGLRVVPDFDLFASSSDLEEIRRDLSMIRDEFEGRRGEDRFFARSCGFELYLALGRAKNAWGEVPFYDATVARFHKVTRRLFDECLLPLVLRFETLYRFAIILKRDANERLLQRIDPMFDLYVDQVRIPFLDLLVGLTGWADGRPHALRHEILDRVDSAVAMSLAKMERTAEVLHDEGVTRGLRYQSVLEESGRRCLAPSGEEGISRLTDEEARMAVFFNRFPESTLLSRLGREMESSQSPSLADLYESVRQRASLDAEAALYERCYVKLPTAVLEESGIPGV